MARKCSLGWTVLGRIHPGNKSGDDTYIHKLVEDQQQKIREKIGSQDAQGVEDLFNVQIKREALDYELKELVELQWQIERGLQDNEVALSREDRRALNQLHQSVRRKDGKIMAKCLWRVGEPSYPNNFSYAFSRLLSLERHKMFKDPQIKKMYNDIIKEWQTKSYVREVPQEECRVPDAFYLPTFGVLRRDKDTTKLRVVVDAKARFNNKSLNDGILPGPKLINDLVNVLLRFRHRPVAIAGDVSEMFLQILLDTNGGQNSAYERQANQAHARHDKAGRAPRKCRK